MDSPLDGTYIDLCYGSEVEAVVVTLQNQSELAKRTGVPETHSYLSVGNIVLMSVPERGFVGCVDSPNFDWFRERYLRKVEDPVPNMTLSELRRRTYEKICAMRQPRGWCTEGTNTKLAALGLPFLSEGWTEGYGEAAAKAEFIEKIRTMAKGYDMGKAAWLRDIGVVDPQHPDKPIVQVEVESPSTA